MNELRLEVWNYLDGLKNWQLDLVKELLHTPTLSDAQLDSAINMLLNAGGMSLPGARTPDPIAKDQYLGIKSDSAKVPSVLKLYELENVSAVQRGQSLDFSPTGLTIVFGNNAAGKSSYARVLKQSCRTVDEKVKILANIYEEHNGKEAVGIAKIDIKHGDEPAETIVRSINTPPEPRLRSISIFDSKCGSLYLTAENDVAYVPHDLVIIQRLAANQDRMKTVLQDKVKLLKAQLPSFPEFVDDTSIKQKLRDLSAQSKPDDFSKLAAVTDEDVKELAKLEKQLQELTQADPSRAMTQIQKRISDSIDLTGKIKAVQLALADEKKNDVKDLVQKLKTARDAAELARGKNFGDELVAGVGSESWKSLWSAAREYFCHDAYPDSTFPPAANTDQRCPLCQQEITEEAGSRLKKFEEFVSDKTEATLQKQQLALQQARALISSIGVDKIESHGVCAHLKEEAETVWKTIEGFCTGMKTRQADLIKQCDDEDPDAKISIIAANPIDVLEKWVEGLRTELKNKEALLQPGRKDQLQKQISELKARQSLQKRIADVLDGISKHKELQVIESSVRALSTTSMTIKLSEFMEQAVTAELGKCLDAEMKALNCADIPVKIGSRGEKGKTKCHIALKSVDQAGLADVLSQGEQRGLSLAFFLAEVGSAQHNGPIILDDPVSSLDHLRRTYVAERLVQESQKRQVIIFTHDIVFLLDLQSAAKKFDAESSTVCVRKVGKTSGIASKTLPWIAQNCKERKGYLKNDLQRLQALERAGDDPDRFEREMKAWYELLREAWERAIEERLFGGVVERFRYGIETQKFKNVNVTDEKIKLVTDAMTATAARCHDESSAVNRGCATAAEAEADLKKYEDFLTLCPVK